MSIEAVRDAILKFQHEDPLGQSPVLGKKLIFDMARAGKEADNDEPHVTLEILRSRPELSGEDDEHYALFATDGKKRIVFNPVRRAKFPLYNGPWEEAPGRLQEMIIESFFQ